MLVDKYLLENFNKIKKQKKKKLKRKFRRQI